MNVTESNTFSSSVDKNEMLLITTLTALPNALYICPLAISVKCNMKVSLSMTSAYDGTITKTIIGNIIRKKHVCNTYLSTSQVKVKVVFSMTSVYL